MRFRASDSPQNVNSRSIFASSHLWLVLPKSNPGFGLGKTSYSFSFIIGVYVCNFGMDGQRRRILFIPVPPTHRTGYKVSPVGCVVKP